MTYALGRTGALGSRGALFGFILLGHVGFFWLMNTGLVSGSQIAERIFEVVEVMDPAAKEELVEPPPPPPNPIEIQKPVMPLPTLNVADPGPPGAGAISTQPPPPAKPQVSTLVVKKVVLPMTNPRRPLSQPSYPSASQRLNEEGRVTLDLYVLPNGRVGDAKVAQSSGYPRLDQAALEEAKRSWRLLPGTEDGQPVAMWHQLGVTFRLSDRG